MYFQIHPYLTLDFLLIKRIHLNYHFNQPNNKKYIYISTNKTVKNSFVKHLFILRSQNMVFHQMNLNYDIFRSINTIYIIF